MGGESAEHSQLGVLGGRRSRERALPILLTIRPPWPAAQLRRRDSCCERKARQDLRDADLARQCRISLELLGLDIALRRASGAARGAGTGRWSGSGSPRHARSVRSVPISSSVSPSPTMKPDLRRTSGAISRAVRHDLQRALVGRLRPHRGAESANGLHVVVEDSGLRLEDLRKAALSPPKSGVSTSTSGRPASCSARDGRREVPRATIFQIISCDGRHDDEAQPEVQRRLRQPPGLLGIQRPRLPWVTAQNPQFRVQVEPMIRKVAVWLE